MRLSLFLRYALAAAALAILLGPAAARAQIDPNRLQRPDLRLLSPPELEITGWRVYDNNRDGQIGQDETFTLVVGVKNNGELTGSFDYALGPEAMNAVWWKATGVDLGGGRSSGTRFDVTWQHLTNRLGTARREGFQDVCLGLYLLRRNTNDSWTDTNNPNHRERVCFKLYRVPA